MTRSNFINTAWKIKASPYTHHPTADFIVVQLLDEGFKFFPVKNGEIIGAVREPNSKFQWIIEGDKIFIIFKGSSLGSRTWPDNIYKAQVYDSSAKFLNGKFYKSDCENDAIDWSAEKVNFNEIIDELERERQKRIENSVQISVKDIADKLWEVFGYSNGEAGELSILNHVYERFAPHISIDYMLSNTTVGSDGIERLDIPCPLSNECYTLEAGDKNHDKDRLLKEERISVRLWYYLVDNIETEWENFIESSDTKYFFTKGQIYSREDLENSINEWWNEFLNLFTDYTILSDEEAEEICDSSDLSDDDIYGLYLELDNLQEIKMENLSSNWSGDSFTIV